MGTKRRNKKANAMDWRPARKCPNCQEVIRDGHFAPPSLGSEGFFICTRKERSAP